MSKPKPKPIRLTKQRALALLRVFEIGSHDVEEAIRDSIQFNAQGQLDALEIRAAKERDYELARAKDAAAIIRARYLDGPAPVVPNPTLFD